MKRRKTEEADGEARGARPRPTRRQGIRRQDLPDRVRHLEFGPPRFNLGKELGEINYLGKMTIPTLTKGN